MGLQAAGGLYGQYEASKRRKKEDALIKERKSEISTLFNEEMATPYFQSAEAQDAQEQMKEQMDDVIKGMKANAVSSGATAEATLAAKDDLNKRYGNFMSGLAAMGTRRKDSLRRNYETSLNSLFGLELGQAKGNTQSAVNFGQNAGNIGQAGLVAGQLFGGNTPQGQNPTIPLVSGMTSQGGYINMLPDYIPLRK